METKCCPTCTTKSGGKLAPKITEEKIMETKCCPTCTTLVEFKDRFTPNAQPNINTEHYEKPCNNCIHADTTRPEEFPCAFCSQLPR